MHHGRAAECIAACPHQSRPCRRNSTAGSGKWSKSEKSRDFSVAVQLSSHRKASHPDHIQYSANCCKREPVVALWQDSIVRVPLHRRKHPVDDLSQQAQTLCEPILVLYLVPRALCSISPSRPDCRQSHPAEPEIPSVAYAPKAFGSLPVRPSQIALNRIESGVSGQPFSLIPSTRSPFLSRSRREPTTRAKTTAHPLNGCAKVSEHLMRILAGGCPDFCPCGCTVLKWRYDDRLRQSRWLWRAVGCT